MIFLNFFQKSRSAEKALSLQNAFFQGENMKVKGYPLTKHFFRGKVAQCGKKP